MKASRLALASALLWLAFAPIVLGAQGASLSGLILVGTTGKALAEAELVLPTLSLTTRSDTSGYFRLQSIPAGTYEVNVRAIGYQLLSAKLTFEGSREVRANFQLTPNAPTLETVTVNGQLEARWAERLAEFEQRRHSGAGAFLTHDKIEKNAGLNASSLLGSLIPGLRIMRLRGSDVAISSRGARNCPVQVILNRLNMYNGESLLFDINSIAANEILGAEYYNPFSTPSEFNQKPKGPYGGSRCGTLLVWLK